MIGAVYNVFSSNWSWDAIVVEHFVSSIYFNWELSHLEVSISETCDMLC